ncbi:MAG: 1,6-anhydro-N-acetylmuramyl-L-alanine amidase AmpD [Gammaproteobacteria bacterium]|nr:1,6-anhydro-N-acetylmuramyl-L-alanine amidase AmpD [Gammaproteobacteria bacterium]MBU6509052.1 1,6-anhydro-N-acetylmuramyl-L-alanine amidase AmpD [Gammaproteobacteria bacterium]MDE1983530.1 1,6-anhydro-N-acetylmuramyl-L-alanine amidase AmpD [Gammaproteobacteria bacterium]MDE2107959.1 1,6-anhydro-N-acetylmuramyl-L-alanine amidase AmpD [Gammaproteobacteria bacterium]MDE2460015.1 1,6-anhydro-N-acetylmuramyl-L-alanine amidase AmpD [Gammaproteobacteria bacterium]
MDGARFTPSPHCDVRPAGAAIDLLVIHGISLPPGEFGGPWIEQLFLGSLPRNAHPYFREIANPRVAAHLLIRRDGTLRQFVPFTERAWHAGVSSFGGRTDCNDFSIGIELEGTDHVAYTDAQYAELAAISRALMRTYPGITPARIVGHADIAPGRKTDPGPAFDWPRLRGQLAPSRA